MKRLLFALLLFPMLAQAQSEIFVGGVEINQDSTIEYIQIVGSSLFRKVWIVVDYGQEYKLGESTVITDSGGKAIKLNSMIAALNWFHVRGWETINAYPVSSGNGAAVYHYLLKRKE